MPKAIGAISELMSPEVRETAFAWPRWVRGSTSAVNAPSAGPMTADERLDSSRSA